MTAEKKRIDHDKFHVSTANALLGSLVHKHTKIWLSMGDLESKVLRNSLDRIAVDSPVFIAGLTRSGSTILLELFAQFAETCTHQYRDFPPVFTPFWWNWLVDRSLRQEVLPTERAHANRIQVTPESPEAFEEPIWMAFFPGLHDPAASNILDGKQRYPAFERFYDDHIRKLLMVRKASRYVSKGNYNISRLQYLQSIYPDARFVIPIRGPSAHVASLMKQHSLYRKASDNNTHARNHLRWAGHFEFGLDRSPINMGDSKCISEILQFWKDGHELRGWARYWSHIYGAVADQLETNPQLKEATIVVRYEDFCRSPAEMVRAILTHTDFQVHSSVVDAFSEKISLPTYYTWPYSDNDLAILREETSLTALRLGYS